MNKEVKKILEKEFDYDFKSEFYTDEILLMIEEVIKATTLQLLQTGVVGRSEQLFCQCKNPAQWTTDEGFTGCVKCNKEIKAK